MSPKTLLISIGVGAGLLIIGPIGWQVGLAVAALIASHQVIVGAVVLLGVGAGLRILWAYGRLAEARARQAEIMPMQNGHLIHVDDVTLLAASLLPRTLADYGEAERIRAAVSPALTHYHNEVHAAPPAELLKALLSTNLPQLAGPESTPQLVAADEWRRWIDRAPHLLIAGRTEAGKTTLATAILIDRALKGDAVLVLDPHYQPGKWGGVHTIGGGNNFEAILSVLPLLIQEMDLRFKDFEQGRPTDDFQRLTVLIDEVPAVVNACMEITPSGGQKITDPRWGLFAKRLGSEARKVRISVILLTQSLLVKDIQINSQLRDNYLRIGLGDRVPDLLEEASGRRRAQLHELRIGQAHPAAMEWLGEIHMLDTSQVQVLAERSLGPSVQVWTPPALPGSPTAQPSAPAELFPDPPAPAAAPASERPTVQLPPITVKDQIVMLLEARVGQWLTHSEIAAALGVDLKVIGTEAKELYDNGVIARRATKRNNERVEYTTNQPTNRHTTPPYAQTA